MRGSSAGWELSEGIYRRAGLYAADSNNVPAVIRLDGIKA